MSRNFGVVKLNQRRDRGPLMSRNHVGEEMWRSFWDDSVAERHHESNWPVIILVAAVILIAGIAIALGRDLDGRYAQSPLKPWFDHLASGKGLCCSMADGEAVADPDWEAKDGHFRVRLGSDWITVEDDAVITEPNRAGRTMVWPMRYQDGSVIIRCFMPGSMT